MDNPFHAAAVRIAMEQRRSPPQDPVEIYDEHGQPLELASDPTYDLDIEPPAPLPTGIALTERERAFVEYPYAHYDALRERDPVHRDAQLQRILLTRHDDVRNCLADPSLWRDPSRGRTGSYIQRHAAESTPVTALLTGDDPEHAHWRSLLEPLMTYRSLTPYRSRIGAVIKDVIDILDGDVLEFELVTDFARPVAANVIGDLLGVPKRRLRAFRRSSFEASAVYYAPPGSWDARRRANRARSELTSLFRAGIKARRTQPQVDLLSALLGVTDNGTAWSDDEVVRHCHALVLAGVFPLATLLTNSVKALLQDTLQASRIVQRPELVANGIEEIMRFDTSILNVLRVASHDMVIGDCPVRAGETLCASVAAANRDPAVYPEPDTFDVLRLDTHHQTLGVGAHTCLGAELVRIIARDALFELFERFDLIEMDGRGWRMESIPNMRAVKQMWVRT
jgi:cytochrome P450